VLCRSKVEEDSQNKIEIQNKTTTDKKHKVENKNNQRSQTNAQSEALRFLIRNCTIGIEQIDSAVLPLTMGPQEINQPPPKSGKSSPPSGQQEQHTGPSKSLKD
jgi:hypothetical protein